MSKNAKNILNCFVPIVMVVIFIIPLFVSAVDESGKNPPADDTGKNPTPINITIINPFKQNTIEGLIKVIVNDILMPIGAVIAVMMIMYAGFMYVTAGGDPGKIKKAHDALLWAVIGAAILLGAWVIETAISATITQLKA